MLWTSSGWKIAFRVLSHHELNDWSMSWEVQMIPGLCSSLTKEQKGKDFDIHLSCLHIMDYPFLTCHLTPLLRTPLAQRILLQPYEGLLPSVEFMKEVKGKYFPFKSLARSNCGDVSRRQPCLARRAILKLSRCLKRMPPLIFDLQRVPRPPIHSSFIPFLSLQEIWKDGIDGFAWGVRDAKAWHSIDRESCDYCLNQNFYAFFKKDLFLSSHSFTKDCVF